jgi:hypothetical protein
MTRNYETTSNNLKSIDWTTLPPGDYEMKGDEFVPVSDSLADYNAASDHFVSALRRLVT